MTDWDTSHHHHHLSTEEHTVTQQTNTPTIGTATIAAPGRFDVDDNAPGWNRHRLRALAVAAAGYVDDAAGHARDARLGGLAPSYAWDAADSARRVHVFALQHAAKLEELTAGDTEALAACEAAVGAARAHAYVADTRAGGWYGSERDGWHSTHPSAA